MRSSPLTLLLFCISIYSVECGIYEIWNPDALKELFENNTRVIGDFVSRQKQGITDFIDDKTTQINDGVIDYISRAKNVSGEIMGIFQPECAFNPDVDLSCPQIIARHGYPVESHLIQTEDGYILTLHRIPRGKNSSVKSSKRQPVFLQHGLLASSADWVISGPEKALAYILADAGYDVWMGNVRGNTYSRAHVNLSSHEHAFWNFSWHEVGIYDLPASIDYVNKMTGSRKDLIYIGHSMGTTVLFVLLSMRPEYNDKIKAGFALAPEVYMTSIKSPIRLLAPFADNIELIGRYFGGGEFLPQSFVLKWLAKFGCEFNHIEEKICENSLFILCGFDELQFNRSMMPVIFSHTPAGASTKSLVHYAQEMYSKGKFQMYNYGDEGNMAKYSTKTPPEYPIDKITLPIALFSAHNDWLSSVTDGKLLYKKLKNPIAHYEVPMPEFNHLDFIWGIDAPTLVYKKLFELMNDYKKGAGISWNIRPDGFKFSWDGHF